MASEHQPATPSPLPSPSPTKTTAKTAIPQPSVTVTKTEVGVAPAPAGDSVWDIFQGLGALLAVAIALAALIITIKNATRDRDAADTQLKEERTFSEARLQRQLDDQRDRDRRQFITEQMQKAANLWAQREIHQLPGLLVAIPDQYATILRYLVLGEDFHDIAGFPPMSAVTEKVLEQQLTRPGRDLVNHGREQYLIDKILGMREGLADQGKSRDGAKMHPASAAMYRVGYDFQKIKHAWLYEEIGENIAEVLGQSVGAAEVEEDEQRG